MHIILFIYGHGHANDSSWIPKFSDKEAAIKYFSFI